MALAEAAGKGTLPQLEDLDLGDNQIGDAGVMALAEAAKKGTLPQQGTLPRRQGTISQQARTPSRPPCPT